MWRCRHLKYTHSYWRTGLNNITGYMLPVPQHVPVGPGTFCSDLVCRVALYAGLLSDAADAIPCTMLPGTWQSHVWHPPVRVVDLS